MRSGWVFIMVAGLLAGCGGGGGEWARPGVSEADLASEYQACREIAATAVRTDADIDQDIRATRGQDWQRGGVSRVSGQYMQENTRDRANAIVASCMRAKGFSRVR